MLKIVASLAVLASLALGSVATLRTQAVDGEPTPTDLLWAFTPRTPFLDPRVDAAIDLALDQERIAADAGLPTDSRVRYGDAQVRALVLSASPEDVPVLFAAAGLLNQEDDALLLTEVRRCLMWIAPAPSGAAIDSELRSSAATALADGLSRVFDSFGVATAPCGVTSDIQAADIVLWGADGAAPEDALDPIDPLPPSFLEIVSSRLGPLLWAFSNHSPFDDLRVADALDMLIDEDAALRDAEEDAVSLTPAHRAPPQPVDGDLQTARELLSLAGLAAGDTPTLHEMRPCAVWASTVRLRAVAFALGEQLTAALADLGIEARACEQAPSPLDADLFVWEADQRLLLPQAGAGWSRPTGGFLASDGGMLQEIALVPGANEIVWPGPTADLDVALAPIAGQYTAIFHWLNAGQQWTSAAPGLPPALHTLHALERGRAYWIFMRAPAQLPVPVDQ